MVDTTPPPAYIAAAPAPEAANGSRRLRRARPIDGAVLLGGCEKSVPGVLMGAIRVHLPVIVCSAGPMSNGPWRGVKTGASSIPAADSGRVRMASACGERTVSMIGESLRPSKTLTPGSFHNAAVAYMALGGSTRDCTT